MTVTPRTENIIVVKSLVYTSNLIGCMVLTLAVMLMGASPAWAQLATPIGVDSLITVDQPATLSTLPGANYATPCNDNTFPECVPTGANTIDVNLGDGNNRVLQAVIVGGNRFEPASDLLPPNGLPDRVFFRRDTDPALSARESLFYEYDGSPSVTGTLDLFPNAASGIVEAMRSNIINRGIDDVFNNTNLVPPGGRGDETGNNIQRVDYVVTGSGIQVPLSQQNDVGFLILERGGNDSFGIAAITNIDGAGTPTAYGPLVEVDGNTSWGNSTEVLISTGVLRRDNLAQANPGPAFLVPSPQNIQGIFFPISSLLGPPQNTSPIYGYSLFAADVTNAFDLTQFNEFPITTTRDNNSGGLDLIAGGFGLIRRTGGFSLVKRVTNLLGPATLPDFSQVLGTGSNIDLLRNNNLGQGQITIADPPLQTGNGIEYTIYLTNSNAANVTDVVICDQIPAGTTFNPDGYGSGLGIEAIASSSPPGPEVTYTSAADGDPGTFFPPGAALPTVCGANQNNGAVVVTVGLVNANQVGLIRFQTTVN